MSTTHELTKLIIGVLVIAGLMIVAQHLAQHFLGVNPFYLN